MIQGHLYEKLLLHGEKKDLKITYCSFEFQLLVRLIQLCAQKYEVHDNDLLC